MRDEVEARLPGGFPGQARVGGYGWTRTTDLSIMSMVRYD